MNIITNKPKINRLEDGINTLLSLNDEDFERAIELLRPGKKVLELLYFFYTTDRFLNHEGEIQLGLEKEHNTDGKFIGRAYLSKDNYKTCEILKILESKLKTLGNNSIESRRIKRILEERGLEAYKKRIVEEGKSKEFINKAFEIILDDNVMKKFLEYDNNKEYFYINGKPVEKDEYLKLLADVFGKKDENGELSNSEDIYDDFFIPEIEQIKERYLYIYDKVNLDKFAKPEYQFKTFTTIGRAADKVIRDNDEPEWNINKELEEKVIGEMPEGLTVEEKAMYIYCKLCKELLYDEGFKYKNRLKKNTYEAEFSKERLEQIKPGSKVVCWDFARIFAKMVNSLNEKIDAVVLKEGVGQGHFSTGFYTDNVSVILEAIDVRDDGTNDLTKVKNGVKPEGIEIISDHKGLINKAISKVMPLVCKGKEKTIDDYIKELKSLSKETIPNNIRAKLFSFCDTMRKNNIFGNEAVLNFGIFIKSGFFGEELEKAFLGEKIKRDGKETYKRMVLIRSQETNKEGEKRLFVIDTDTLKLYTCLPKDIIMALKTKRFVYEDNEHRIKGIGVEEK